MGQIIIEGKPPAQSRAFIDFLAQSHPVDFIVKFRFKAVVRLECENLRANGLFWPTITGNALIEIAAKHNGLQQVIERIYRVIAHEYYHALQRLREEKPYRGAEEESEANRFAARQVELAKEAGIFAS